MKVEGGPLLEVTIDRIAVGTTLVEPRRVTQVASLIAEKFP